MFFGIGKITKLAEESVQLRVSGLKDLNIIINHFDNYPLLTCKNFDYLIFKQVIGLMKQGLHLTSEGLSKIVSIKAKATLNRKIISDISNLALPCLNYKFKINSLHWLAGFTDAEGCFFIALKKSPKYKLGCASYCMIKIYFNST